MRVNDSSIVPMNKGISEEEKSRIITTFLSNCLPIKLKFVRLLSLLRCGLINKFFLHLKGQNTKDIINILSSFSTALHIGYTIVFGKLRSLLVCDFSMIVEVHFIANNHDLGCISTSNCKVFNPAF